MLNFSVIVTIPKVGFPTFSVTAADQYHVASSPFCHEVNSRCIIFKYNTQAIDMPTAVTAVDQMAGFLLGHEVTRALNYGVKPAQCEHCGYCSICWDCSEEQAFNHTP